MKKRILAVAVAGLMAMSLAACGGSSGSGSSEADKTTAAAADSSQADASKTDGAGGKKINVIAKGFQHQFWKAVEKGAMQAGSELGAEVTFQGPDNESSGVPDAPAGAIKANASTNNLEAGKLAADETYKLIKDKIDGASGTVRIGVVAQESNSQSIVERTKGFVEEMKKNIGEDKVSVEGHDSLKAEKAGAPVVIDVGIPAEVKDADAAAVASAILEKSDLIAIYGSNEFAANAIITANEGLDKIGEGKVTAVGFDAGKKQLQAIKDGLFAGSVTQDPVQIGYKAVELAVKAANGESVSDVDTGALWYTKDNMEDPKIAPCLYE